MQCWPNSRREGRYRRRRRQASEALLGKGATGVGFKIFFECQSFVFIRKSAIPNQFPRLEFCRVRGLARIMVRDPLLQIGGCPGVFLFWRANAADDVDVPHRRSRVARTIADVKWGVSSPSSPAGYAGHASLFGHHVAAPRVARRKIVLREIS